ncbi:hypothetical protein ACIRRA_26150 [Nocardia sp. NPDC101769]|uniref:hypothetical protein n=1 Tax=Nocardia sp. NPDC101769 TaxID=3364333 RepID=UPI00381B1924
MSAVTEPSKFIIEQNQRALKELPFDNIADEQDADRGSIAKLEPGIVKDDKGTVIWDDSDSFL